MKRYVQLLIFFFLAQITFDISSGYAKNTSTRTGRLIVATVHPVSAILKELVGDRIQVETLLSPANSPHTFEPKPSDLRKLENAVALFYVGPNLDKEWISKLPAPKKVEMLALLPNEYKLHFDESMHDHHGDVHGKEVNQPTIDPHFWTDPVTVKSILMRLVAILSEVDPAGSEIYTKNAITFTKGLDSLDAKLNSMLAPIKSIPLFLFHPSFNYLIRRYGLFLGGVVEHAPGKEPTAKFMHHTVKKLHQMKATAIFSETQSSKKSVRVLAEAAGVKVYELDPIGGIEGREAYRDILIYNVETLTKAFN